MKQDNMLRRAQQFYRFVLKAFECRLPLVTVTERTLTRLERIPSRYPRVVEKQITEENCAIFKSINAMIFFKKNLYHWRSFWYDNKMLLFKMKLNNIIQLWSVKSRDYIKRKIYVAKLYGPCDLRLDFVKENKIKDDEVRIDVHYCGITMTDMLLWTNEHRRVVEKETILGFEATGKILEIGRIVQETNAYYYGEEVLVHIYPSLGAFAETCIVHYENVFSLKKKKNLSIKDAVSLADDYFSPFLILGRRTQLKKDEYLLINTNSKFSATATINIASCIFQAKPIIVCNNPALFASSIDFGAVAIIDRNKCKLSDQLERIIGKREVRLIIDTIGGKDFGNLLECLEHEGTVALLDYARDSKYPYRYIFPFNYTILTLAMEHYKNGDSFIYRETMENLLDYQIEGTICPHVSAIFGLNNINKAFEYGANFSRNKILIDIKNPNVCCIFDS